MNVLDKLNDALMRNKGAKLSRKDIRELGALINQQADMAIGNAAMLDTMCQRLWGVSSRAAH